MSFDRTPRNDSASLGAGTAIGVENLVNRSDREAGMRNLNSFSANDSKDSVNLPGLILTDGKGGGGGSSKDGVSKDSSDSAAEKKREDKKYEEKKHGEKKGEEKKFDPYDPSEKQKYRYDPKPRPDQPKNDPKEKHEPNKPEPKIPAPKNPDKPGCVEFDKDKIHAPKDIPDVPVPPHMRHPGERGSGPIVAPRHVPDMPVPPHMMRPGEKGGAVIRAPKGEPGIQMPPHMRHPGNEGPEDRLSKGSNGLDKLEFKTRLSKIDNTGNRDKAADKMCPPGQGVNWTEFKSVFAS